MVTNGCAQPSSTRPNVVFIFADQLRYQATAFGGDPNVLTPYLDELAAESLHFTTAVSGCPVCSPARASLLTGQYPDRHGVFFNDAPLSNQAVTLAEVFQEAGYQTAYIGKWHLNGPDRSAYIPEDSRQGFEFWKAYGVSHIYNQSPYYDNNDPTPHIWEGYDAIAQTTVAREFLLMQAKSGPFLLMLSWGPPHPPYDTAPEAYKQPYDPDHLALRPNVPSQVVDEARQALSGYYAHISVLDNQIGLLLETLRDSGLEDNTIVVFWSDHGDMLGSHAQWDKQRPWDESILVPLLIHYPNVFGKQGRLIETPINTADLMPTLLGLCGLEIPATIDGLNFAPFLRGEATAPEDAALIACYHPFANFSKIDGGREYRGIRTLQYTYVRDLDGPWLLYDNQQDPYQLNNLIGQASYADTEADLDQKLNQLLARINDQFLSDNAYLEMWGYETDERGRMMNSIQ
ncbi:MAG: sulfatase [Anaerolineae bacterium]|nr:sulfatase [Anaerolineae bacterium]